MPVEKSVSVGLFKKQTSGSLSYPQFKQLLKDMFVVQSKNHASKFQQLERLLNRRQNSISKSREQYIKTAEARTRLDQVK